MLPGAPFIARSLRETWGFLTDGSAAGFLPLRQYHRSRGRGRVLHQAANSHLSNGSVNNPAGVAAHVKRILADGLPSVGADVIGKGSTGELDGLAVVIQALEVVRAGRSTGEEYPAVFLTRHRAKARRPRMRRQLAPLDLVRVFVINLTGPALVGRHVRRAASCAFLGPINVDDHVVGQPSSVAKHGHSRRRRGLAPGILLNVVDL